MKAIDVHAHYGNHCPRGRVGLVNELRSGTIEQVRARARAVDVCLTVVSPLQALHPYGGTVVKANRDACAKAEQYDDIRFWAVLDPRRQETYRQVEELLQHPRCKGIKIHPVNHDYEIRDHGDEIFAFAAAQRAIVLSHCGCPGSFPEHFIPFVERHPEAVFILAHLGNSADGNLGRHVQALQLTESKNVYVDTSSIHSMSSRLIEWAVEQVGPERFLFGTDTPLYFTASQKARIEFAELDEAVRRAILYDNAARLLGEEATAGA